MGDLELLAIHADEPERLYRRALELDPGSPPAHARLSRFYYLKGLQARELEEAKAAAEASRRARRYLYLLGHAYVNAGQRSTAEAIARELGEPDVGPRPSPGASGYDPYLREHIRVVFEPESRMTAFEVRAAPRIDGALDEGEWRLSGKIAKDVAFEKPEIFFNLLHRQEAARAVPSVVPPKTDNTARFGVWWDARSLYLAIDVRDSVLRAEAVASKPWDDDSVEVFLDGDFSRGTLYDEHDRHFIAALRARSLYEARGLTTDVAWAIRESPVGYSVEMAVPWSGLGLTPGPGDRLGLDLGMNDNDGRPQQTITRWAGVVSDFASTGYFGMLRSREARTADRQLHVRRPFARLQRLVDSALHVSVAAARGEPGSLPPGAGFGYAGRVSEQPRPRVVMARVRRGRDDERAFDLEFWDAVGAEGRFSAAWEMVSETSAMRGGDGRQPRLQRSVCRVERRRR